jgi:hypothetical protein
MKENLSRIQKNYLGIIVHRIQPKPICPFSMILTTLLIQIIFAFTNIKYLQQIERKTQNIISKLHPCTIFCEACFLFVCICINVSIPRINFNVFDIKTC